MPDWKYWKIRMAEESRKCLGKLQLLRGRGAEESTLKPVYKPPPGGVLSGGKGSYHCPLCDSVTHFDRNSYGQSVHVCSSPACEWYFYNEMLLD